MIPRVVVVDATSRGMLWVLRDGPDPVWRRLDEPGPLEEAVPRALTELDAAHADALVAVVAPGSLTGIRVSVAALAGVAAVTGVALHAAGALEVVALSAAPGTTDVVAVRDAGRGGLWMARYRRDDGAGLVELAPPARVDAATWVAPGDAVLARLDGPGDGGPSGDSRVAGALRCAAALAMSRPPLDLARLDPSTGAALGAGL